MEECEVSEREKFFNLEDKKESASQIKQEMMKKNKNRHQSCVVSEMVTHDLGIMSQLDTSNYFGTSGIAGATG